MAFEDSLLQYGALGVMVFYLMWKDTQFTSKYSQVIDNNTIALTKVAERLEDCPYKK